MAKVAVITGSNGKIGQAACRRLAQSGHTVIGIDLAAEGSGNWPHYQCNLADLKQMADTLARIEAEHGLIQVLFNNAAIYNSGTDALTLDPEKFDATMDVNVRAPFFATQWIAKRLIEKGEKGAVVSVASRAGQNGSTVVDYGASKAAVINMTKSLGKALGPHGIRVNAILPGIIEGPRIEGVIGARATQVGVSHDEMKQRYLQNISLRRMTSPYDVASMVAFLLSDAGYNISGQSLGVDGNVETL